MAWLRATLVLSSIAFGALGAGVACGGASTVLPPLKTHCSAVYYGAGVLPSPPDGASLCAAGICNYQTQEGCSAGQTCAPHVDAKAGTVTPNCRVAGQRSHGEPCSDATANPAEQCARGFLCAEGECRTPCCGGDWSACGNGESCIHQADVRIGGTGDSGTITYAGTDLCFPVGGCNVLDANSCVAENGICRIADPIAHVACMPPSDLGLGATCDEKHPCGAVLHCVTDATSNSPVSTCRRLCPWGVCSDKTCGDAGLCVHFNRDPAGVGECTPDWHGDPILVDGGVVTDASGLFASVADGG